VLVIEGWCVVMAWNESDRSARSSKARFYTAAKEANHEAERLLSVHLVTQLALEASHGRRKDRRRKSVCHDNDPVEL
jgi:hypothetical protein